MTRDRLASRLENYWKLEAVNTLLVPVIAVLIVLSMGDAIAWRTALPIAATSVLLAIGAVALRAKFQTVQGDPYAMQRAAACLGPLQLPAALFCATSVGAAVTEWGIDGGWTPSAVVALLCALLAVLEYINYYVVQLQHFDNAADWRRLWTGGGFRKSHLARAILKYRHGR